MQMSGGLQYLFRDLIEVFHGLLNVREVIVPVCFVLDREVALEILSLELLQHPLYVEHARAPNYVFQCLFLALGRDVLEV